MANIRHVFQKHCKLRLLSINVYAVLCTEILIDILVVFCFIPPIEINILLTHDAIRWSK